MHTTIPFSRRMVRIIGSGASAGVPNNENEFRIYCNSSILRRSPESNFINCLFISDGLLQTTEELRQHPPATGLDEEQSYLIRLKKVQSIEGLTCEQLVVMTNRPSLDIRTRVAELGITCSNIDFLDGRKVARMILKAMRAKLVTPLLHESVASSLRYIMVFSGLSNAKLPLYLRPSTGVAALLWTRERSPSSPIVLDGIGNSDTAYYPTPQGSLRKHTFNHAHKIDRSILSVLEGTFLVEANA